MSIEPKLNEWELFEYQEGFAYLRGVAPCSVWWVKQEDRPVVLRFSCPCGCGAVGAVPIFPFNDGWNWDGNLEQPTLAPSIRMLTKCGWHGYLRKGVFERC